MGLPLIAYFRDQVPDVEIVPAGRWREWMNETALRNANRCLPLLSANEAGWFILNNRRLRASWNGDDGDPGVTFEYDGPPPRTTVASLFGYGILTFRIPYLFRTPPGFDLLVRGPANLPKDGIAPLDGLVETDWATATFTMNWKFTRPGQVVFDAGEPVCMVVPQRRADLEAFEPEIQPVTAHAATAEGWEAFVRGRHDIMVRKFLAAHTDAHADARDEWQGDYFRGRTSDGRQAPEHKTKRRLRPFEVPVGEA